MLQAVDTNGKDGTSGQQLRLMLLFEQVELASEAALTAFFKRVVLKE